MGENVRFVHLSDTHGSQIDVPDGDVLIHTGDISRGRGTFEDCHAFEAWMQTLPHKTKILVPGNHDKMCQHYPEESRKLMPSVQLLVDEGIVINGITIWGTPWSVQFLDWAFMLADKMLGEIYKEIWSTTDILASHGPAYQRLDYLDPNWKVKNMNVGSVSLAKAIDEIKPEYVLCGHIHYSYGRMKQDGVTYLNSAIMNEDYKPVNAPQVFDL